MISALPPPSPHHLLCRLLIAEHAPQISLHGRPHYLLRTLQATGMVTKACAPALPGNLLPGGVQEAHMLCPQLPCKANKLETSSVLRHAVY